MFNLGLKTSPSSQILVFPVIFENTAGAMRQEYFFDLHVVFVKNGRITTSFPIVLSITQ